jgi:hypothetical protein
VSDGFEGGDFERAVALVGADPSPLALVERLGIDWDDLRRLAVDAATAVLVEQDERRGEIVSQTGEAFTAGFLVGVHLAPEPGPERDSLPTAVEVVQVRGRHAVIADHCDLSSVARVETLYSEALVASMDVAASDAEALRAPVTRVFETGLAVGLEVGSGGASRGGSEET